MSDTGVGGGSPAEATSDDTGTKFGLCCCVPNPKQMSGLQAIGDQYGFRPIPCAAGFGDPAIYGCVTGNRRWNRMLPFTNGCWLAMRMRRPTLSRSISPRIRSTSYTIGCWSRP